jgi:segregation and condensation protein A
VFARDVVEEPVQLASDEVGLVELSVYKLIEALDRILKERLPDTAHEVVRERVSLSAAMTRIAELLREKTHVPFTELFDTPRTRQGFIITFLALLELCKLRLIRVHQDDGQEIQVSARGDALNVSEQHLEVDENEYR